ncbi:MAG: type II toxin-antitoxin system death-on-curing family toxin [Ruminococcus sp.]|nr:type II toxin-antitoxin system death-on-curing family toxin [Ruminococcus sp.]
MKVLSKAQVLKLHEILIAETGGSSEIRDEGLLDSALNAAFQSFGGMELYPSLLEKSARLGYGLIKNHPFVDGNKRIGTHVMLVFMVLNCVELKYEDHELIDLILGIASGRCDEKYLLSWLQQHVI